jgi:hypothetical protein
MKNAEQYRMQQGIGERWIIKEAPGWRHVHGCLSLKEAADWIIEHGGDIAEVFVPGSGHPWKTLAEEIGIKEEDQMTDNKRHIGRPNKATELIPKRNLDERLKFIQKYHEGAQYAYGQAATYAILAGLELAALRDEVQTNEAYRTKLDEMGMDYKTAQKYVVISDLAKSQLTAGRVQKAVEMLESRPSDLRPKERELLMESVTQLTQGHSINELWGEWTKTPEEAEADQEPMPRMSAEDQIALQKRCISKEVEKLYLKIDTRLVKKRIWSQLSQNEIIVLALMIDKLNTMLVASADQLNPKWRTALKD